MPGRQSRPGSQKIPSPQDTEPSPVFEIKDTFTVIHEIGHLFGAIDHYDESNEHTNIYSTADMNAMQTEYTFSSHCIYGGNKDLMMQYESVDMMVENLSVCDGCRAIINGQLVLESGEC